MKPNRGLGKGLSALFSETEEDYGKSLLFPKRKKITEKVFYSKKAVAAVRYPK